MFGTGETVDLAEWIIDDTCLVFPFFPSYSLLLIYAHLQSFTQGV